MIFFKIVNRLGGYYSLRQKHNNSKSKFMRKIYSILNKEFQHETNSYLPFNNIIDGPINFLHGTYGIFISGGSKIGMNCTIYQQVTIGSNMLIDSKGLGSPTIGNNCVIGAGAKIIGNVKIGNNCRIGANAVVVEDLPDNSVCVMGKSLIIEKNNLINTIYQFGYKGWGFYENGVFVEEGNPEKIEKLNQLLK